MVDEVTKILIDNVTEGFKETKNIVAELQKSSNSSNVVLEGLKKEVSSLNANVEILIKIIRDGDGRSPPLVERVIALENFQNDMEKWREEKDKTSRNSFIETKKGKWQIKNTVVAGIFALAAAFVGGLIAHFIK